ncbi:transposon Tf2-9 polyprotein [Trichonephila clavipes]|nr:transposon Tf2-9 polyprotein [Trichonephila clavipes]
MVTETDVSIFYAFSRISAIVTPSTIDYEEFAQMQQGDDELKALFSATNQTLQLKQLRMPGSTTEIYCDIFMGTVRPHVPHAPQRNVFLAVYNLSHPGIRATAKLISKRFIWTSMNKDIHSWTRSSVPCQRVKIQRHTNSELGHFKVPATKFTRSGHRVHFPQRYVLT